MAEIDIDKVIYFSKNVAQDYLTKNADMNQSIAKIASESGLNNEQIQRVVETTNHIVYQYLYKKAVDDKNIVFPLADSNKVLGEINNDRVKVAEQTFSPEAQEHESKIDYAYGPGYKKQAEEEIKREEVPDTNKTAYEEMAKYAKEFREAQYLPRFAELIKSAMVEGSSLEADPRFIDKYLVICKLANEVAGDKWEMVQPIIEKVASHYYKTGFFSADDLQKLANSLVGSESLPDLPSNKVVNGDHILIKTLRAYISTDGEAPGAYPKGMRLETAEISES